MELKSTDHDDVPAALCRMIDHRIDKAIRALSGRRGVVTDTAIHESRKQFKQIRATLKLLRKPIGKKMVREADKTFRNAGRPLSEARDAKVMIDTLDELVKHFDGRVQAKTFGPIRRALFSRRREMREQILTKDHAVRGILSTLRSARKSIKRWPNDPGGWNLIAKGIKRSYRAARKSLEIAADDDRDDEALHECRKRAKDLRYQLELLVPLWPAVVEPTAAQAKEITDLLGVDHDLAVLRTLVIDDYNDKLADTDRELLLALIDERRLTLQRQARRLGRKLFAERPRRFVERFKAYWVADDDAATVAPV